MPMASKYGSRHELLEYESVKRWMNKVSRNSSSQNTQKTYLLNLRRYIEWFGKNPDEMIEERKQHDTSNDKTVKMIHEDRINEFFTEIEQEKSRNTAVSIFKVVKSFYSANHFPLKTATPRTWTTFTDKVPSLDEIHKMVEASESPVQKALILFSAQSGQRVGILTAMTYGMLKEALDGSESPASIYISSDLRDRKGRRVNKNRREYTFFVGRDTIHALKMYVEYMENKGYVFNDDSPLFVTDKMYSYREFAGKEVEGESEYRPMNRKAINTLVRRAAMRAGLISREGEKTANGRPKYAIHHHVFRKFWQTAMEQAGVAKPWYEYMMGHALGKLDLAYSRPTVTRLREAYVKAQPYLSVSRLNIMPDMDQIRKEMMLALFKQQAQMMNFDPERIAITKAQERGEELTIDEEIELLQETILNKTLSERVENNCHEHKVVDLSELTGYLNKGWELLHEVSGGKQFVLKYPVPGTATA